MSVAPGTAAVARGTVAVSGDATRAPQPFLRQTRPRGLPRRCAVRGPSPFFPETDEQTLLPAPAVAATVAVATAAVAAHAFRAVIGQIDA